MLPQAYALSLLTSCHGEVSFCKQLIALPIATNICMVELIPFGMIGERKLRRNDFMGHSYDVGLRVETIA